MSDSWRTIACSICSDRYCVYWSIDDESVWKCWRCAHWNSKKPEPFSSLPLTPPTIISPFQSLMRDCISDHFRHERGDRGKLYDFYKHLDDSSYIVECFVCEASHRGTQLNKWREREKKVIKSFPIQSEARDIIDYCKEHQKEFHG